jgi:hypothetical protein
MISFDRLTVSCLILTDSAKSIADGCDGGKLEAVDL